MRSPVVEDEPTPAQPVQDGPAPEAITDGHPGHRAADSGRPAPPLPSVIPGGHEPTRRVAVASGSGLPTRAGDRLDAPATGSTHGALTDLVEPREPVLKLRAPSRQPVHCGRHVAPTGQRFAVRALHVLERAWDESAVRVLAPGGRLGEPGNRAIGGRVGAHRETSKDGKGGAHREDGERG